VGSFNGWSPVNSEMRVNKYGEWEINLYLAPGRYTYRFLVDDKVETVDPSSPYTEPDGYGGQNSVLYVQ
jgi:1,4-alpha-glucan branching enzyme